MDTIIIPLIIIMALALIFYTVATFTGIARKSFGRGQVALYHAAVALVIIGIFYMSGISSKLSYAHVSYAMMHIHTGLGYLAVLLLIIHAIVATVVKRKHKKKGTSLGSGFNKFSFVLWLICIILYLVTFYIGILAGIK